jgi:CDP-diacylglycerol--serine O-phosphatidyltransferase
MKNVRFLVPNLFTAGSILLGLASILFAFEAILYWSAWCIIWCALLDKADGTFARLLNASSSFGIQFDSMADLISFGLAPAFLIYSTGKHIWHMSAGQLHWWLLVTCCILYAFCTSVRLARFNTSDESGHRYFQGLPSTVCGAIVASALLVAIKYNIMMEVAQVFSISLALMALGMVSNLPVPKLLSRSNKAFNYFQFANVVAIYLCGFTMKFPEYVLFLALLYIVVGSVHGLVKQPWLIHHHVHHPESS